MSCRTPGDAIRKFSSEISSSDLLSKYEQIINLVSGPIRIAKEKLKTIDAVGSVTGLIPGVPAEYKGDLRRHILESYSEEVETAEAILKEIEDTLSKLTTISETFNQRVLEGLRSGNSLVVDNRDLLSCHDECRQILIYLKLKHCILKNYLGTPYELQPARIPLSELTSVENTAVNLIIRLKSVNLA